MQSTSTCAFVLGFQVMLMHRFALAESAADCEVRLKLYPADTAVPARC